MKKAIICMALMVSGCVSPSGLSGTVPNPEDPKYSSPNCRAIRAMAADYDFRSWSRTSLVLAAESSHKPIKDVPKTKSVATHQARGPMIEAGMRDLCSS